MTFKIESFVSISKTCELKQIDFCEKINGEEIYYMKDNTSYHVSQLTKFSQDDSSKIIEIICSNNSIITQVSEDWSKEMAKKYIRNFR